MRVGVCPAHKAGAYVGALGPMHLPHPHPGTLTAKCDGTQNVLKSQVLGAFRGHGWWWRISFVSNHKGQALGCLWQVGPRVTPQGEHAPSAAMCQIRGQVTRWLARSSLLPSWPPLCPGELCPPHRPLRPPRALCSCGDSTGFMQPPDQGSTQRWPRTAARVLTSPAVDSPGLGGAVLG